MIAQKEYIAFNKNKVMEDLKYNMSKHHLLLEELKSECKFYQQLLRKPIFKPSILNLYINFDKYKNYKTYLSSNEEMLDDLIQKVDIQIKQILDKIELKDAISDTLFMEDYDDLEQELHEFFLKQKEFEIKLMEYLESVI